ncbi:Protein ZBED8 [Eumeta japonica]|uniref:Protein ZBED8 n=1 Tax=Eumeta variegata TaxID=151549 RepID=A0A4C1Z531_EUMVA|nr:Protein ZBED8 [Eumeta japonica]
MAYDKRIETRVSRHMFNVYLARDYRVSGLNNPIRSVIPKVVQVDPQGSTGDLLGVYIGVNKNGVHKMLMGVHENLSAFDSKNLVPLQAVILFPRADKGCGVIPIFRKNLVTKTFFTEADKQLPMCLLCNKVLSNDSMKPSKLEDHLKRCHTDKIGKDLKYFQTLKEKYEKRPTMHSMFASTSQSNDDGLRASYNISLLIAKSGKPHTIGEQLILPAVEEVLKTVLHKSPFDVLKRIPLSNNTVQRRIDEMRSDIEMATDGAPAMVGRYRGFISHLKRIIPGLTAIHCIIHRQHLVAKHLSDRFEDMLTMDIPPWIINPFDETEVANVVLQEELLELSTNEELKVKF